MPNYEKFAQWLDNALSKGIPAETAAAQLCLYEESIGEHTWAIQFTCSDCFDPDDESGDWACSEVFTTGENLFVWDDDAEWQEAQETAEKLMADYLERGRHADMLRALRGIGVGFAEGDLEIVYRNDTSSAPVKDYEHFDPDDPDFLKKKQEVMDRLNELIKNK